ncbi:RNA polymerase subunit sigma-70 [Niastella yeongjuensis]|uniref:RNA polymerase subunit sigma-70 n=1 Tax=Niastella yeongjuensis TaxID=354355 RepID=A0A1V9F2Z8_9BACT|nr:RNA polymerase sigma-70 factor [Niastella yeongjuensis]OQP52635.1 RNA polymerase subunit sigma-70 [Niastella yeongjuensis]SEP33324.1 RNA polymerase sigma-70 factor, ECF subfamily [Niastella yeongjuensis]
MSAYDRLTDQELTTLLKQGDNQAFTAIYHRYKGVLYLHAYKRLQSKEDVNDLIHELFTTLWQKRDELNITQLSGYLYTAVRNRVLDCIARKQTESNYIQAFQQFIDTGEAVADHRIREQQLAAVIEQEIASLPAKMREVFELSRKAHLSHREIAERLDLSELTVKKHVNNALKILRGRLTIILLLISLLSS